MARNAALVITWGASVRGREAKSIEVFMESLQFWGKQAAEGTIEPPEAFIAEDASGGMLILRGKSDALRELNEGDDARRLLGKAQLIVEDLKAHWYYTGDDEVTRETSLFSQVANEMGYM
jgi:hypothetical protein